MATFNRYNSVPETLPDKEFALVKVGDGFKWYVGDENNNPVPLSREVETATAPNHPVPLEQMEEAIAASGSGKIGQRVFSTSSSSGAVDDADISLGSTTFGTDSTTELQSLLDEALNGPMTIVWDGRYSVSSTLKIHSNTHIIARPGCGVILRNASNCYVFENANVVNPSELNGWNSNIVDENIIIENLIINGNGYNTGAGGSSVFDTDNNGHQTRGSAQTKRNQIVNFVGVRGFIWDNVKLLGGRYWAAHFANIEYTLLQNTYIDFGDSSTRDDYNYDGLHFKGGVNHLKIKNTTIINAKDDNIAFNSHAQLDIYNGERGPITNVEVDGVFLDSRAMGIGIYSETYRVDEISIKNLKGTTNSHFIRITNGETATPDGNGNIGKITLDDIGINVLAAGLADFGGMIYVRCNVEKLTLKNLTKTDFTKATPYIALTDDESYIGSLIIDGVQMETTGGSWANPFLSVQKGSIAKCLINNVTHLEATSFINAPIVDVDGGEIIDLVLSNIDTEKISKIITNPSGIIKRIKAVNVGNPGSSFAAFTTAGTVEEIFVSNYLGGEILSGTFNKKGGDALAYLGERVTSNLPDAFLYKGSLISVTNDPDGYIKAFSNGIDWVKLTSGESVTPTAGASVLLTEDFTGTEVDTSKGTISNPDSANLLVEQNNGILFSMVSTGTISGIANGWNSVDAYGRGAVAVDLNKVTGDWLGVFAIRWIFNGTQDFISIQGDSAGGVRIAIKAADILEYDYRHTGTSIYQRFKIVYTDANEISVFYFNGNSWTQIGATQIFDLGDSGTLTLSSSTNTGSDTVGEQFKYNRLRITDEDYETELP